MTSKFLSLLAACLAISACNIANAADIQMVTQLTQNSDSLNSTINWVNKDDGNGPIDSVNINISGGIQFDTTIVGTGTSLTFTFPVASIDRSITVTIKNYRKGKNAFASKQFLIPATIPTPPVPDSIQLNIDSLQTASIFATPRTLSPHFDFITRTYTDFCNCWDGTKGAAAKKYAARIFDLVMSGNRDSWKSLNPNITWIRYILAISTLDEANKDPNSITGKFQDDFRQWAIANSITPTEAENSWLHKTGSTVDSSSRLNPFIWSTKRFFGNPRSTVYTTYTKSRFLRSLNGDGFFLDEMDHNNLRWLQVSQEFADIDTTQAHTLFINWIADLRHYVDSATGRSIIFQTNAAGYSKSPYDKAIGIAAGSMHLEQMNLSTQEQVTAWNLIDELLAKGVYVDFVAGETWQDMLNPKWITKYPGGNYQYPVYRSQVSHLASYYMAMGDNPRQFGLQAENNRYTVTPDSSDLKIFYLNVGKPIERRTSVNLGKDIIGQIAKVWKRDYTNARILYRAVNSYEDSIYTDTTKVSVPDSLISGYSLVNAKGQIIPLNGLSLRNGEAAILIPTASKRGS